MTDKQSIQHALDNWQDENYIAGFCLYVLNSCLGHDKYNLDYEERESFREKLGLISVKFKDSDGSLLMNKVRISKRIVQMEKENKELRKQIYKNRKYLQAYSIALSV